jgi:hypothetical protein
MVVIETQGRARVSIKACFRSFRARDWKESRLVVIFFIIVVEGVRILDCLRRRSSGRKAARPLK